MSFETTIKISYSGKDPMMCGDCERVIAYRVMGNFICGVWREPLDSGDGGVERCPQCLAAEKKSAGQTKGMVL